MGAGVLDLLPRVIMEPKKWSWREELNLQPAVYKTAALPLSYASKNVSMGTDFVQVPENLTTVYKGVKHRLCYSPRVKKAKVEVRKKKVGSMEFGVGS